MKFYRAAALGLGLSLALTSCGGTKTPNGGQGSGDQSGSVLTIAIQDEVEGCDIQQIGWENVVQSLLYEPLVVFNPDLSEIQPAFAESYTVAEDGTSKTRAWDRESCYLAAENFRVAFTEDAALVAPDFPRPVLQLEIDASLPWLLEEENDNPKME